MPKHQAALLLGTNLGDREENLATAREKLSLIVGEILHKSSIYITAAWGLTEQPDYLNQALLIETSLSPGELLDDILSIEYSMGRVRSEKWGPRIIDIDILYYDSFIVDEEDLKIPHSFMPQRRFSLLPLAEISPAWVHPVLHLNVEQLLAQCPDQSAVTKFEAQNNAV